MSGAAACPREPRLLAPHTITDALVVLGSCNSVTRGTIDARFTDSEGRRFDAEIDYHPEDGSCDDIVAVKIEGETILTHLADPSR